MPAQVEGVDVVEQAGGCDIPPHDRLTADAEPPVLLVVVGPGFPQLDGLGVARGTEEPAITVVMRGESVVGSEVVVGLFRGVGPDARPREELEAVPGRLP